MDTETMAQAILAAAREWREDAKKLVWPAKNIPAGLRGQTFSLNPQKGGTASEGGEEAGETGDGKSHGNTRLPYGLCKKYGIEVPPGTTPREAWDLLKGKGVNPRDEYRKLKERGERKAAGGREAEERAKREAEEKARREAEEKARREAEEKARREAEEKARREAEERSRREAEEKDKREAEEKARREAEERAKREAEEKARKEAEERAKREAEERAKREAKENAGGGAGAAAGPEPERLEPMRFPTAQEASYYLAAAYGCNMTDSWRKGVCADAQKEIAGTVAALEERYHALDRWDNLGWRPAFEDGVNRNPRVIASAVCWPAQKFTTGRVCFYAHHFKTKAALERTRNTVRDSRGEKGDHFYMPSAEGMEIAYLAAHEYGHCVEYRILRDRDTDERGGNDAAEEIKAEIVSLAREIEPGCEPEKPIKEGGLISEYGRTDPYEFFAECFANSVCGEPNALGRAMAVYLDRHGIGRDGA